MTPFLAPFWPVSPRRSQPTAGFSSAFCPLFAFFFPQTAGFSSVFWPPFSPKKYHGVPSPRPFDHVLPTFFPQKMAFLGLLPAFCPLLSFPGGGTQGIFLWPLLGLLPTFGRLFYPQKLSRESEISHSQTNFFFPTSNFGCLFDIYKLS